MTSLQAIENRRPKTTGSLQTLPFEKNRLQHSLSDPPQKHYSQEFRGEEMKSVISRLEDDKKRLSQRIEKLTANEKALVSELERLKRHGCLTKSQSANHVGEYVNELEADRDYWRSQVEVLQRMIQNASQTTPTRGKVKSKPPPGKTLGKVRETSINKLETKIQELQADRDRLQKELENSRRSLRETSSPLTRSRSLTRTQNRTDIQELTRLRHERDEMQSLLSTLEKRVQEVSTDE
ncbi:hypothetical protein T265_02683 [Opisthorchis viverrini]|uniref:Uncharacterized protein n=1 Tax=Opisthorchis viverrini TaxID=6198 RepID=A0A074ZV30_OPIVI|nr:hypothetical protein T265_02683 [Opisthorchis viverrini]KER31006.1 hypothetical protein T265_02683 [Opisthorchis viverrini]